MSLMNWFNKKKPSKWERQRLLIESQIIMSDDFYTFVRAAFLRGYDADFIIRVDGQTSKTYVCLSSGTTREFFEFMVNWAAGEKQKWSTRLDEHEKENPDNAWKPAARIKGITGSRGSDGSILPVKPLKE